MNFSSDTAAPAHPRVIDALLEANTGMAQSYGQDELTTRVRAQLIDLFETDTLEFWICASGTAANALALSCFCPPTGAILCHEDAHIECDERGAPEFFTGGGKLSLLPGDGAKINEDALRAALTRIDPGFVHETPPHVLSLTNLTECGTAYSVAEVTHFSALAHAAGLHVHLDGARLGNALVSTRTSLADMSWRAGIDILTLGLTKTGAIGCELILLFGTARSKYGELCARAKRAGHMPPKMRYLAAQAEALLRDNLWLSLAENANHMARKLANALCGLPGTQLAYPVEGNEVFAKLDAGIAESLSRAGAIFYPWPDGSYRFVCNWTTQEMDIQALIAALKLS